jgi:hypothetical protein
VIAVQEVEHARRRRRELPHICTAHAQHAPAVMRRTGRNRLRCHWWSVGSCAERMVVPSTDTLRGIGNGRPPRARESASVPRSVSVYQSGDSQTDMRR